MFVNVDKSLFAIISFLRRTTGPVHVRKIAEKTGLSLGKTSQILREMKEQGLVLKKVTGRMTNYSLNTDNPVVKQIKVLLTVWELRPIVEEIKEFCKRIVLYGSTSRGEDAFGSDIDLFILGNPEAVKRILRKRSNISPLVLTAAEFSSLREKDPALYEQLNRGIELIKRDEC